MEIQRPSKFCREAPSCRADDKSIHPQCKEEVDTLCEGLEAGVLQDLHTKD